MKKIVSVIFIVIVLFFVLSSLFFVREDQYAYVYRFNKVITIHDTAGIKFKVPFLDSTTKIKKNYQLYDIAPSEVLTKDKKTMIVDSYIIWKISEPKKFIQNIPNVQSAGHKLDNIAYNAIKNNISNVNQEVAISRDEQLSKDILADVSDGLSTYGMEAIDIQVKQLDLPDENKNAVYNRMISERNKMSETYIAEGKEEAEKIRNSTDKETAILRANAEAEAAKTVAEGESEYMRIISEAYNSPEREEYYKFVRSLDALKVSMIGEKTLVLPIDSDLGQIFLGIE